MATTGVVNWSQTAASNNTADSGAPWPEGMAPSQVNDSARGTMASVAKYRDDVSGSLTTGGTSTAYTLTTNQDIASFTILNGKELSFTMHTTSGATPTLNVNSLGAKAIRHATGATLPTGALISGSVYRVKYNSAGNEFLLMDQLGVVGTGTVATASIADGAVTLAKQANLAQNTFIGRYTASTGVPQALTLSTGLAVNASTGAVTTSVSPANMVGYLSGLELSTAGSSATFGIAVGAANDVAQGDMMLLGSAYTKTTSAWAVGSGNGGLDTSTIANSTWYHVFLIKRPDTGVVDVLFSTSASAPTMPTSYTLKRRIGAMKTNGSAQWTKFTQTNDTFIWDAAVLDVNAATTTTSRVSTTLTVPTGVVVEAMIRVGLNTTGQTGVIYTSLQESDQAATFPACDIFVMGSSFGSVNLSRLTNTSAQIGVRSTGTGASQSITTYGWRDFRGK